MTLHNCVTRKKKENKIDAMLARFSYHSTIKDMFIAACHRW